MMASPKSSFTDVLIVGAGPAGLMAAAWASKYNVCARIIDEKPDRVQTGHADGLTCRTMEILDSFGLAQIVAKESSHDILMRSWAPSASGEEIERKATVVSQKPGVSRFQQCLLHQGRLEQLFQEVIEQSGTIKVERNVKTLKLRLDDKTLSSSSTEEYPIALEVQQQWPDSAIPPEALPVFSPSGLEIIHAKYLIGCDGAHSWTRRQLGVVMRGETTDAVWGVLDIVPLTDFPDIRQTCAIHSKFHGAIHLVPREGKIVRFYIQLTEIHTSGRFDRSSVNPQLLLHKAQNILAPFTLDYSICNWWSVYQVGQRVADQFDVHNRVFFAGDAVHTHSPKVGQGMNVSLQDTYNLGWKICSVIAGLAPPGILHTYETERRPVALELLEVDRVTSKYYSGQTADEKAKEVPREDLQTFRNRIYEFLSGVAVSYGPNLLVQKRDSHRFDGSDHDHPGLLEVANNNHDGLSADESQRLARHVPIGQRMPSFQVLNHASVRPTAVAELLTSTGQWRMLVFAGDVTISSQMEKLKKLGSALADDRSCLQRYSRLGWQSIELFTFIAGKRDETPLLSLPVIFHPYDEKLGWDYGRVFSDEEDVHGGGGDAYERYGIDRGVGCVVCCRPDQHVGFICALEETAALEEYFGQVMGGGRESL